MNIDIGYTLVGLLFVVILSTVAGGATWQYWVLAAMYWFQPYFVMRVNQLFHRTPK